MPVRTGMEGDKLPLRSYCLECLCKTASRCQANMTHTTVKTRFWPWLEPTLKQNVPNLFTCSLVARNHTARFSWCFTLLASLGSNTPLASPGPWNKSIAPKEDFFQKFKIRIWPRLADMLSSPWECSVPETMPKSASLGTMYYCQVVMLGLRYKCVNF
jgi:hypothetical protein